MGNEIDSERRTSLRGLGMMLAFGGTTLLGLWLLVPIAIEGPSAIPPARLPQLIVSLHAIMLASLIGYVLGRDLEILQRAGQEASRAVTVDWLLHGMMPFLAYVLASAVAVNLGLGHRQAAAAEAAMALVLAVYGLALLTSKVGLPAPAEAHS